MLDAFNPFYFFRFLLAKSGWVWMPHLFVTLFLLTSCSGGSEPPDPELIAQDDWAQYAQRLFSPKTYWEKKVIVLDEQVEKLKKTYREQSMQYRKLVAKRRQEMLAVQQRLPDNTDMIRAEKFKVLDQFRQPLGDLRDTMRLTRKQLDQSMRHWTLSKHALAQATAP